MLRATFLGLFYALVLSVSALPQRSVLAQQTPELQQNTTIPNSGNGKFPDVAAFGNTVHLAAGNGQNALYWEKQDTAPNFGNPENLGRASGAEPQFTTASVATGPDGTIGFAWIDQVSRGIQYRQKAPGGAWGPATTVIGGGFRVDMDVGITSNRTIIVVWRDVEAPIRYRTSTNGGATWSATVDLSDRVGNGFSAIANGANNQTIVGYAQNEGDDTIQVHVASWNGTGFTSQRLSGGGGDHAGPSVAISGTGVAYVSWYRVGGSVFYAERQPGGQWNTSRLTGDAAGADRRTAIAADAGNNLHIFWQGSGASLGYAFRPGGGGFAGSPIQVPNPADGFFNPNLAATVTGTTAYAHGAAELFGGRGLENRYLRFAATGAPGGGGGGSLIIENGARIIAAKPNVSVSFPGITNPTEYDIRWRWGEAPTDAANESNGWQTLSANPFPVPVSSTVNVGDCVAETLFAQLRRKASPNSPLGVVQGSIIVDNAVNVGTQVTNPNLASRASTFTSGTGSKLADLNREGGARDGDATYTRQPSVMVQVSDLGDCSKAQSFTIVRNTLAAGPYGLTNGNFSAPVPIPDFATLVPGDFTVALRVRDEPGNVNETTQAMVYDTGKPTLNSGDLAVTPRSDGNILVTLNFTNLSVSDNLYPRDAAQRQTGGYWGVWVANSPTPVSNPTTDENLVWTPVAVSQRGAGTATVSNWSLLTGLSTQQIASVRPGQPYTGYIYVRFLDGAGNPSDAFRAPASAIQLQAVSFPRLFLPIVGR